MASHWELLKSAQRSTPSTSAPQPPASRRTLTPCMLARCADKDKYFSIIDLFFGTQREWVVPNPLQPMFNIAKQAGYNEETFNACLKNQQILDGIQNVRDRAAKVLNVESTPTFFINGKRVSGEMTVEQLDKEIAPLLPKG